MIKQDLIKLRDKVAAGVIAPFSGKEAASVRDGGFFGENPLDQGCTVCLARDAHNGSLDAAVAFLEAVLPGWDAEIRTKKSWACVNRPSSTELGPSDLFSATSDTPARALFLATLDALIERAE